VQCLTNLPEAPYKRFFGREEVLKEIKKQLLEGGTFIVSLDGPGGIGKTALAHYFCQKFVIPSSEYQYLVWITAKKEVFDPSRGITVPTSQSFRGIRTLIDTTLLVCGGDTFGECSLEERRELFEDIIHRDPVFFVLDNLETIEDESFFDYVVDAFNRAARNNRQLKVLTTSRRRKKIIDFPIEVGSLEVEDALKMLKYLAEEYEIKDILKASDYENIRLLHRVGRIPLAIEFVIHQMRQGKSRGEVFRSLEDYATSEDSKLPERERQTDLVVFCFKDTYEALQTEEQHVFKCIAVLERLSRKQLSQLQEYFWELLIGLTGLGKERLEVAIENLLESKLLVEEPGGSWYSLPPLGLNFVDKYLRDSEFEKWEDEVAGRIIEVRKDGRIPKKSLLLSEAQDLFEQGKYEEAEDRLLKAVDANPNNAQLLFELARVQRFLHKFNKAADNFRRASELDPLNVNIWRQWINMEEDRRRYKYAINLAMDALEKTGNNVAVIIQVLNIYKFLKQFREMREWAQKYYNLLKSEDRRDDLSKLLRTWKNIEYNLIQEGENRTPQEYFKVVSYLEDVETDKEIVAQLLREARRIAEKYGDKGKKKEIESKLRQVEEKVARDLPKRVKVMCRLFNNKEYADAKKEARKIIARILENPKGEQEFKNEMTTALRILLQILATEKDYNRIIYEFTTNQKFCETDQTCREIWEKAQRELKKKEKEKKISEISLMLQQAEGLVREACFLLLGSDEENLVRLASSQEPERLKLWEERKRDKERRHGGPISLLDCLDFGDLRWLLKQLKGKIKDMIRNTGSYMLKELHKNLVAKLENVNPIRNDIFHALFVSPLSLIDYTENKLLEIEIDVKRLRSVAEDFLAQVGQCTVNETEEKPHHSRDNI
jgi:tetratricopeptide (TPR) repeat protein